MVRLNMASEVNRKYAERIGATDTPAFILFDRSGQEVRRWHPEAPSPSDLPQE
jgi:hypothetical protein